MTETVDISTGEVVADRPPLPPKVASAIAEVMKEVPKLAKGEKNEHGKYSFASIDDFLEAVRPLCAKHGLIILQDEDKCETREAGVDRNGKPVVWLVMTFAFTLAHSSGETWGHRPKRTIMVQSSMGSQAFGAAQSYALKQFERSLFQIATGDREDADHHPNADLPAARCQPNGNGAMRKAAPKQEADSPLKVQADRVKHAIDACETIEQIGVMWEREAETLEQIKTASATAYEFLASRAENRRGLLAQAPAQDAAE